MPDLILHILGLWATLYTLVYPSVVMVRGGYSWLRARRAKHRTVRVSEERLEFLLDCEATLRALNALRAETLVCVSKAGNRASGGQD